MIQMKMDAHMKNICSEHVEIFACENQNDIKLFHGKTANFIKENRNGIITIRAIAKIEDFKTLDEILENFQQGEMYSENLDFGGTKEHIINKIERIIFILGSVLCKNELAG